MEYAKLGTSDLVISRIGFGCWAIGGHGYGVVEDSQSIRAIHRALDLGVNFFDTAGVYGFGRSETVLAEALGERRRDAVIATKFGVHWDEDGRIYKDSSPGRVVGALEESLRRLNIDCIPLYQIHFHDQKTPIADTMEALLKCRDAGKLRYIGCTNFPMHLVEEARRAGEIISIQARMNVIQRENESLLKNCFQTHHMGTIIYGALMRGLFTGKYDEKSNFGINDTRSADANFQGDRLAYNLGIIERMRELGQRYNQSCAQIALRWVLDSPYVTSVIVGAKSEDQVVNNVKSIGWHLEEKDWPFIECLTRKIMNS